MQIYKGNKNKGQNEIANPETSGLNSKSKFIKNLK